MAEKPGDDATVEEILKRSAFTCSAVYADITVRGMENPLRACHASLKTTDRSLADMREAQQGKLAILVQLDAATDKVIVEFVGRLLILVGKKYDHPLYVRYVPKGLRDITQADMRTEEPVMVTEMIKLLNEDLTQNKPGISELANEFMPKLQQANDAVITAEKDLTQAETDANHVDQKTIPALIVDWMTEYKKLEAALTAAWPLDADRVQRCFKPFRKPKKKAAKPDGQAKPGPTGPSGGNGNGATAGAGATGTAGAGPVGATGTAGATGATG
jgi:hypothetical protein